MSKSATSSLSCSYKQLTFERSASYSTYGNDYTFQVGVLDLSTDVLTVIAKVVTGTIVTCYGNYADAIDNFAFVADYEKNQGLTPLEEYDSGFVSPETNKSRVQEVINIFPTIVTSPSLWCLLPRLKWWMKISIATVKTSRLSNGFFFNVSFSSRRCISLTMYQKRRMYYVTSYRPYRCTLNKNISFLISLFLTVA